MRTTLIAVWGVGNSGKTTTIETARKHFRQLPNTAMHTPGRRGRKRRMETYAAVEVRAEILLIDGVKVGFTSAGDRRDILEEDVAFLLEERCVVIVCGAHTKGGTVDYVRELEATGVKVEWIPKTACDDNTSSEHSSQKAKKVIGAVEQAIENLREEKKPKKFLVPTR